jgi:cell pole-organizing protein PopZ
MQAPQSTHVDAPQPIVAETQTKRKALTDAKAQQQRQKSTPAPVSAPTPVSQPTDIIEQAASSAQDTSSAIIPQGPTTDEVIEDIPSASSADPSHDPLQAALSSQAQEIVLKQVNRLTVWFIISPDTTDRISNSLYFTGTRFSR